MGELMRRYWHPIAASAELDKEPTKAVRLLGEDLVLYRDRSGALGLIGQACAHRRVNLLYGIPEQHGLRCPYHGWLYNERGQCLEQPAEAPDSTFKDRIRIPAYPVQELGGVVFAYLGPEPAPLLPRWDLFVWDHVVRGIGMAVLPCNWLQCMENSADPVHTEWLHGRYFAYVLERQGGEAHAASYYRRHKRIGFDVFEHGLIKRRVLEGQTEEDAEWRVGHPLVFPNILRVGGTGMYEFQYRVPMDDTHTFHLWYTCYAPGVPVPKQETVPYHHVPLRDEGGRPIVDYIDGQDILAWMAPGELTDRTAERLAESDKGVILYRRLLEEQMARVADGADPMNVFRGPAKNAIVALPQEENKFNTGRGYSATVLKATHTRYSSLVPMLEELYARADKAAATRGDRARARESQGFPPQQ
jgi:5,5'-dehydrodivanillate O-demethylase